MIVEISDASCHAPNVSYVFPRHYAGEYASRLASAKPDRKCIDEAKTPDITKLHAGCTGAARGDFDIARTSHEVLSLRNRLRK